MFDFSQPRSPNYYYTISYRTFFSYTFFKTIFNYLLSEDPMYNYLDYFHGWRSLINLNEILRSVTGCFLVTFIIIWVAQLLLMSNYFLPSSARWYLCKLVWDNRTTCLLVLSHYQLWLGPVFTGCIQDSYYEISCFCL